MFKYLLFFLLTTLISSLLCLEFINNIFYFILTVILIGLLIARIFFFKINEVKYLRITTLLFLSLITTYILFTSISVIERDIAFAKVSSVPKETLKKFYKSQDFNTIPKESRYAWIGCFYRKIGVVPEDKFGYDGIKAVGWKHNSVSAYYHLNEDKYTGSYH